LKKDIKQLNVELENVGGPGVSGVFRFNADN
jgi:hypothetical protein